MSRLTIASARPRRAAVEPAERPSHPLTRGLNARWALVAIVALALVVLYTVFHKGSWVFDDNFILVLARQHGFTLGWLETPLYQHWGAGTNAGFSVLLHFFPIDYRWGLAVALIALGGTAWVFERVLVRIAPTRVIAWALTAWFVFSILWIAPLQWWTFSVQVIPNELFDLVCLYSFLRFQAGGGNRWIAVSAGAVAAGLLFYEKPAFMLFYLGLIRCFLMEDPLRVRALAKALWTEWRLWSSYIVVLAVWAAAFLSVSSGPVGSHVSLLNYLRYFRIMWAQTLVPAVFGLAVPGRGLGTMQVIGVIIGQLVVVVAVAVSVTRSGGAARAWLFLAIVVLATGVLVIRSRIALFGVGIGGDPRYLMDFTWLIPLAVCAAANGGSILPRVSADGRRASRRRYPHAAAIPILAMLLLVYVGASLSTAVRAEHAWPALAARHWYENVRQGLARLDGPGRHAVIADDEVAPEIMGDWEDPYSRLSSVLPLYAPSVQVDGPLRGPLVYVDATGTMHRAAITPLATESTAKLVPGHHLVTSGMVRIGAGCYRIGASGGNVVEMMPALKASATPAPLYVVLDYRVTAPARVPLYLDVGAGFPDAPDETIALSPGATSSIGWLRFGTLRRFMLGFAPGSTLCMSRVTVIRVNAATR